MYFSLKPIVDVTDCNTNNIHEYDPYIVQNNCLYIDKEWWENDLTNKARDTILQRTSLGRVVTDGSVKTPHHVSQNETLKTVYFSYIESFDYEHWYSNSCDNPLAPRDVHIRKLSEKEQSLLILGRLEELELTNLREWIQKIIDHFAPEPVFIRLSGTSGKNEKGLTPLRSTDKVIHRLGSVKLFKEQEYKIVDKTTSLIVMPWSQQMDPKTEFRVFIYRGRVTAASQQHWSSIFHYSSEEITTAALAIESATKDLVKFANTFVADVWIDFDKKTCHLIECNPFGAHCGAGSSLFNWIKDYDILHGKAEPELRFKAIIPYI